MKKLNLFAMSMLAIAAFTFNSCSTDDTMSPTTGQETVDGFYNMTIQVKGSAGDATRTIQSNPENGTVEDIGYHLYLSRYRKNLQEERNGKRLEDSSYPDNSW